MAGDGQKCESVTNALSMCGDAPRGTTARPVRRGCGPVLPLKQAVRALCADVACPGRRDKHTSYASVHRQVG